MRRHVNPFRDLKVSASTVDRLFHELIHIKDSDPDCKDLLQFRSLVTAHQYRRLYRVVKEFVSPGSGVLDWGCGNGHASYALSKLGYRVSGFSFEDLNLRKHLGEEYVFARGSPENPEALPYAGETFDAVVSVGVLEHVRETGGTEEGSLHEIYRILKPGGHMICYHFPNRFSLIDAAASLVPSYHHHDYRYTSGDIRQMCQTAGLELRRIRRYGFLPRNLWHRAPRAVRNSVLAARLWNGLDGGMELALSPLCQNYLFVARKPLSSGTRGL
jgi:SAM-dependent methyltransferase